LWIDGIHLSAQSDVGIMGNPFGPADGLNFGQLFTDHANQVQLNQILLTANKPLDSSNPNHQWGFKLQFMYGSDARYTQFLGELNRVDPNARYQLDVVEANVLAHVPWFTQGGIDLKAGQYPTPLGYETIDPSTNPFYSHSYIFQFGLPFKHTGGLAVTHVNSVLDIYSGIDTGTNTTFGPLGDNNGAIGGIGGFNLTFFGGKLTILGLTHFGPEQATRLLSPLGVNANGQWRTYNDLIITWKQSDALTLVTEANLVRDAFGFVGQPVNGFGVAQYASYALSSTLTLNGRIEYWRDDNNFFVASFPSNSAFVKGAAGVCCAVRPYGAGDQHDLRRADSWRDLEARRPQPDIGSAGPPRVALGSCLHQQSSVQRATGQQFRHARGGCGADVLRWALSIYEIYMAMPPARHRFYMARRPNCCIAQCGWPARTSREETSHA
jgi:hypothetical protein